MKKRYGLVLFIAAMSLALLASVLLVRNRQEAANQARQIVASDMAGTNVETDVIKLRVFAAAHMKVNVTFTLMGSYNRAVAEAKSKSNGSGATYAAAQASCDRRGVDSIRQSQCVAAYIAANGGPAPEVKLPEIAKYAYQYIGPAWSFDLAGLLFIASLLLGIVAVGGLVHRAVTK